MLPSAAHEVCDGGPSGGSEEVDMGRVEKDAAWLTRWLVALESNSEGVSSEISAGCSRASKDASETWDIAMLSFLKPGHPQKEFCLVK